MVELMKDPTQGLAFRQRKQKKTTFDNTFVGADAVDWMMSRLKITTRLAAVHLGETLMNRGIIEHVTQSEPFMDSKTSLYRFRKNQTPCKFYPDEKMTYLIDMMRFGLTSSIRTHKFKLAKYKNSFKGTDLVDWLTKTLNLTRAEAVEFGQELMQRSVFHHVTFSEAFEDKSHLYRFYKDEKKYDSLPRKKSAGGHARTLSVGKEISFDYDDPQLAKD
ncbi:Phosphatidylinositol 3,4,5-trisphosphate-dependent Rac exchanger 2 protein [Balamuthia mandrillaris]